MKYALALAVVLVVAAVHAAEEKPEDERPKTYRRLIPADVLRGELSKLESRRLGGRPPTPETRGGRRSPRTFNTHTHTHTHTHLPLTLLLDPSPLLFIYLIAIAPSAWTIHKDSA
jgi:hypothetical protein